MASTYCIVLIELVLPEKSDFPLMLYLKSQWLFLMTFVEKGYHGNTRKLKNGPTGSIKFSDLEHNTCNL